MRILIDGQTFDTPDIHRGIGRVARNLCNELVRFDTARSWYINTSSSDALDILDDEARKRVRRIHMPQPDPAASRKARAQAYSSMLEDVCSEHQIDLYWNPNPLMLNVVLPLELSAPLRVCTLFDVIPARLPHLYTDKWSEEEKHDYHGRLSELSTWADHLAFISMASLKDFASLHAGAPCSSSVIPIGVQHETFWASAAGLPQIPHPYLLLVGGADPRKNQEGAILAFARSVNRGGAPCDRLRLRITGEFSPAYAETLRAHARNSGVGERVELLGRVSDEKLAELYQGALALFFPSLYEGFGLPVIEAMACGTPVIVSDRPELRECAGSFGIYCDPHDVDDMAEAIARCLEVRNESRPERTAMIRRARKFSWDRSAAKYAALFDRLGSGADSSHCRRLRVAYATPWPPDRSGIAAYSFSIVAQLKKRVGVEVFVERPDDADTSLGIPIHPLAELQRDRSRFDCVIYHLGNNSDYHREIYKLAWSNPGITVLHDLNIHPFLQHAYLGTPDDWLYRDALAIGYGPPGEQHFQHVKEGRSDPDIWSFPASAAVVRRSRATIVHSEWVANQLGAGPTIFSVPHGAVSRRIEPGERRNPSSEVDGPGGVFVIGVFGFQNSNKRIPSVIEACRRLWDLGYPVKLLLVGENNDPRLRLDDEIAARGAEPFTRITGYVPDSSYWAHLDHSDVVVNLRHPSSGESSGALLRAFGSGKACIVSDFAQYAELPDSVCWKVSPGERESDELVACLGRLLREPELRAQLGENARRYVEHYATWERVAALYENVIRSVAAGRGAEA